MSMIHTIYYGFFYFAILAFWSGQWFVHLLAIVYGKYKLHNKSYNNKVPREEPLPGVSIIKPLTGEDPNLKENLETFFTMCYPTYELLFCIEDAEDLALPYVKELTQKYPLVDVKVYIGGSNVGVNPKVNNMYPGYVAAKYDLVMISDSGIKMREDTLMDMVDNMSEKVGLVHQMPFTCDREGFAAAFEKIFFGTFHSRIYLSADLLGINCHTGMSSLFRKPEMEKFGGLKRFGCYLAEDFFIAKAFSDNGWKLRVSSNPALQNSGICDIKSFQARLQRWTKLRIAMVPSTIVLEPISECFVIGALAAWAVNVLFNWDYVVFYLIHILFWFLSDWILLQIVQNGSLPFNKFEFVIGWLLRELSGPYLFISSLWNPSIKWRTRLYKLDWGGVAYELSSNEKMKQLLVSS